MNQLIPRIAFIFLLGFLLPVQAAPMLVPSPPKVDAKAYIIVDFESGQVIGELNADKRVEPASITKLMTAYAVFHELKAGTIHLNDEVTISKHAWKAEGSRMFVEVGHKVKVNDLIHGMIIQSGNDASIALAEHIAGTEGTFAQLMNKYAQKLGMKHTHYVNATGLPNPQHYTTARDIATLARDLILQFPDHYKIYSQKRFTWNGISQYNRNRLLWRDPSVDGMKTGHTESAGYCLVASAKRNGQRLITVVLGTKSDNARATISQALLNYGFRFFETHKLYAAGKPITQARIWKGANEQLPLGLRKDLYVTIPRGQYKKLKASMELQTPIEAPADKGARYGTVKVTLGNKVVASRPLVALDAVAEGGLWTRMTDGVRMMFQ